jgi:hypothetical protein
MVIGWMKELISLFSLYSMGFVEKRESYLRAGTKSSLSHFLIFCVGDGTTLVSVHRKYYTSAQDHLRKGLGPMCNEAEQATFLNRLQQAVFGDKGTLNIKTWCF